LATIDELYRQHEELKDAGQLEPAVERLLEIVKQDPNYALAHSALAVLYGRLRRFDDSIRHGQRVCELVPDDPFSFTAMSVTYQRAGRIPEAEDAMAHARMLESR